MDIIRQWMGIWANHMSKSGQNAFKILDVNCYTFWLSFDLLVIGLTVASVDSCTL